MYAVVRRLAGALAATWYRVEVVGEPVPPDVPLVVVANHTNGLIDVAVLLRCMPRPVRFLAKFKVFRIPIVGLLARGIRAIPVYRKKDNVPTEWNVDAFETVFEALRRGEVIGIFPEGESGTAWRLRTPLKTGAARMALGAEHGRDFELRLRVLPVAMHYQDRDRFQSRMELRVGRAFEVTHHAAAFLRDERSAVPDLTEEIADALRQIALEVPDEELVPVARFARRLWHDPAGAHHARLQSLVTALARERAANEVAVLAIVERVSDLSRRLAEKRLDPCLLLRPPSASEVRRGWCALPLAVLATLCWGVPHALSRLAGRLPSVPADKFVSVAALSSIPLGIAWLGAGTWALASVTSASTAMLVPLVALGILPVMPGSIRALRVSLAARRALVDSRPRADLARELADVARELEAFASRAR